MEELRGIIPALVTPVDQDECVDEKQLRVLIEHVLKGGVHGLFIMGSTGEFYGLSFQEKIRALQITVDQAKGRVPVIMGASEITTKSCIKLVKAAKETGADAVSVLTPFLVTPNETELYLHYQRIAEAEDIPITLYNNPDRTHVSLSPVLVERLADIPNIAGIKDSSGDLSLMAEYIRRTDGKKFGVMSGKDSIILAALVYGAVGAVAATANVFPKLVVSIYEQYMAGHLQEALDAQYRLNPLRMAFGLGSWPVVTKDALNLLGINVGDPIAPVQHINQESLERLRNILEKMK